MAEVKTTGQAIATIIDELQSLPEEDREKVIQLAIGWCKKKRGPKKSSKQAALPGTE